MEEKRQLWENLENVGQNLNVHEYLCTYNYDNFRLLIVPTLPSEPAPHTEEWSTEHHELQPHPDLSTKLSELMTPCTYLVRLGLSWAPHNWLTVWRTKFIWFSDIWMKFSGWRVLVSVMLSRPLFIWATCLTLLMSMLFMRLISLTINQQELHLRLIMAINERLTVTI